MAAITFYGHQTLTYLDYIDLATGKTLVAAPGQTYNIVATNPAVHPATPTDGRFTAGTGRETEAPKEETPELTYLQSEAAATRRRVPDTATSTSEVKE